MARPDKAAAVAELTEDFRTANATVLTEYRGLSVTSMKQLRRALGSTTKYSVVKNTLTKIAAKDAGVDLSPELLQGPSAVAFIIQMKNQVLYAPFVKASDKVKKDVVDLSLADFQPKRFALNYDPPMISKYS